MTAAADLSKVDRLRIGSIVAPAVRRGSARKVVVVGKDGRPVRETTVGELQAAIARRAEIEFGTNDETRPKMATCRLCRSTITIAPKGKIPYACYGSCRCECGNRISRAAAVRLQDARKRVLCTTCRKKWPQWRAVAGICRVSRDLFLERLRKGWSAQIAATTAPNARPRRRSGLWSCWRQTAKENGINSASFYARIARGVSPETAATTPLRAHGARNERSQWRKVAESNGITRAAFYARLRVQGMSPEEAATKPTRRRPFEAQEGVSRRA